MLDHPEKAARLLVALKAAAPFEVELVPSLVNYLRAQHVAIADQMDAVHEEWIRSVLRNRPDLTRARLGRTRDLMNLHARDALVSDFEDLIDVLKLPDPGDRHALAAAIKRRADVIVTNNLKDFPAPDQRTPRNRQGDRALR